MTPQAEALSVAFMVYHRRNEKVPPKNYLKVAKTSKLAKAEKLRLPSLPKLKNLHILVSNAVRSVTGPGPICTLVNHPDHVQSTFKKGIEVLLT